MGGRPSYLILLIACAYVGAALAVAFCWHLGFFVMLVAAPIGGSFGGFAAVLLLQVRERLSGIGMVSANPRTPPEIEDAGGRV